MNDNKKNKEIKISYLPNAEIQVYEMMKNDIWSFMICINRVCKLHHLDPYNYAHFIIAMEILKMEVSFN
jgi:hypothetical protein